MPWSYPLGALAAFFFFVFFVALSGTTVLDVPPQSAREATSTLAVVPETNPQPSSLHDLFPSLPTTTELSAKGTHNATTTSSKLSPKTSTTTSPEGVAQPLYTQADLDAAAANIRSALVNILCVAPAGSGLRSISGSGVVIDPEGIILTNAHVAQFFLLADRRVSCRIRTGSPAKDAYLAKLIYISDAWVRTNAKLISAAEASGTGEFDFALLAITESLTPDPLPSPFPHVPLATRAPGVGTSVVIGSYGAQFLEANQIASSLFPTVVFGSVKDIFTFDTTTVDVVALGGSIAAQEGSSGGGFVDPSGALAGTITTSTVDGDTSTRNVNALTASYIRADYASETGQALDLLLGEATTTAVAHFAPKIPELEALLLEHVKP